MSMKKVAELAGVSMSTVSRVVNDHPSISPNTAQNVRAAMATLNFRPVVRRNRIDGGSAASTLLIAYVVFGDSGRSTAPAFEQLIGGVSEVADGRNVDLIFSFASDLAHISPRVLNGDVDGLLLGGNRPGPEIQRRLEHLPSVWLMGNRQRPLWGHQVMPDNSAIGSIAADYLADRNHDQVVGMTASNSGWSLKFRALEFEEACKERDMRVTLLNAIEPEAAGSWSPAQLAITGAQLVDQMLSMTPRPTGIFISEDRLVAAVDAALTARGVSLGPDGSIDVISCNNERQYLAGLQMRPATIDINAAAIGRHGMELLIDLIRNPFSAGRTRVMIAPKLIEPSRIALAV
ncbi:MAG TPA: LacI family DNA-binding transcriptional regulator [Tepidisphaeraceae bacterium]|jgi:LacI family transcriptional regulator|nr:LacI family DNA-binding transcriptional regulator [Tepidisphaeraceae bacterium]